jgi:biopolymer transport protein ExbD
MNMRASFESIPMMTRVNVTPIIDVALVLVIILLITAPILSVADLDVEVPQAHTREAEDEHRVLITLGRTGELALDEEILSRAGLRGELVRRLQDDPDALVVVRADQSMPYERVEDLLKLSREAGAQRLAVASRQKGTQ